MRLVRMAVPLVAFSWISIGRVEPTLIPVALTMLFLYSSIGQLVEMKRGKKLLGGRRILAPSAASTWPPGTSSATRCPKIPKRNTPAQWPSPGGVGDPAAILWIASFRTNMVINLIFGLATALFIFASSAKAAATKR